MVTLERFVVPENLSEALELLAEGRQACRPLAGGTSLVFFRGRGTAALVDITRLGLDEAKADDRDLVLGACARLQSLADSPLLAEPGLQALADAAAVAGPRAVRNAVTLGGNVVGYKRWSDTPAALLALDARADVASAAGPDRELPLIELFSRHPSTVLETGELVTRLRLPRPPEHTGSAYLKLAQTRIDYAWTAAAARITLDGAGHCSGAALAIGAVERLPRLLPWAGKALAGQRIDEPVLQAVARRVRDEVEPATDMRASADYLAEITGVVAADALELAARRARGEDGNE
jgi:carbon-monoxide dehydrogenase medium subunit